VVRHTWFKLAKQIVKFSPDQNNRNAQQAAGDRTSWRMILPADAIIGDEYYASVSWIFRISTLLGIGPITREAFRQFR